MIERYVTKERAEQVFRETFEEVEDHGFGEPTVWVILDTGYLPLWIHEERVEVPWDVVLEHGRTYVMHIQQFDGPPDVQRRRRDEAAKLVGGAMPF